MRKEDMRKAKGMILFILIITLFTGCAKCIDVQSSETEVTITDVYHRSSYTTMQYNAATKTMKPHIHPAVYRITVTYNGADYYFHDATTYKKCEDRIGETVTATLETRTYDDGTKRYGIVSIK